MTPDERPTVPERLWPAAADVVAVPIAQMPKCTANAGETALVRPLEEGSPPGRDGYLEPDPGVSQLPILVAESSQQEARPSATARRGLVPVPESSPRTTRPHCPTRRPRSPPRSIQTEHLTERSVQIRGQRKRQETPSGGNARGPRQESAGRIPCRPHYRSDLYLPQGQSCTPHLLPLQSASAPPPNFDIEVSQALRYSPVRPRHARVRRAERWHLSGAGDRPDGRRYVWRRH